MKKPIKSFRRKNPTEITNGIKWYYQSENYINTPKDFKVIVEKVIYEFGKILKQKLPTIINKVPMIVVEDLMFNKYNGRDVAEALFDDKHNVIYVNGEDIKYTLNENKKTPNNAVINHLSPLLIKTLFHELGHFIFRKFLDNDAVENFENYILNNSDIFEIDVLIYYAKFPELKKKYPIYYIIIDSIIEKMKRDNELISKNTIKNLERYKKLYDDHLYTFDKPSSSYIPYTKKFKLRNEAEEEIFCELFSYYMVSGLHQLHRTNLTILQTVLPELK